MSFSLFLEDFNTKTKAALPLNHVTMSYFRVYLDCNILIGDSTTHIKNSPLELVALELRLYGAKLSDTLTQQVSHVIVNGRSVFTFISSVFWLIS